MGRGKRKKTESKKDDFPQQLREYAKKLGSLGGKKRARTLTPERRKEIARKAVLTRWAKAKKKDQ